jgi:hypothetical protein
MPRRRAACQFRSGAQKPSISRYSSTRQQSVTVVVGAMLTMRPERFPLRRNRNALRLLNRESIPDEVRAQASLEPAGLRVIPLRQAPAPKACLRSRWKPPRSIHSRVPPASQSSCLAPVTNTTGRTDLNLEKGDPDETADAPAMLEAIASRYSPDQALAGPGNPFTHTRAPR